MAGIGLLAIVTMPLSEVSAATNSGPTGSPNVSSVSEWITGAAVRFRVPVAWIEQVMRVESGGVSTARSRAGAIGLMQIMPATYANLRVRHYLGADPWQPRDNILAGAAYLRQLFDRYGSPGFLAAYNAGPARWEKYVSTGKPLPSETIRYLSRLGFSATNLPAELPLANRRSSDPVLRRETVFVALNAERAGPTIAASDGNQITADPRTGNHDSVFAAINVASDVP